MIVKGAICDALWLGSSVVSVRMSIVIVDSGLGNIASVANMIRWEGGNAIVSSRPEDLRAAEKLVLPGVGAFDHGMQQLHGLGLADAILARAGEGAPILGICLGMQLLGTASEEGVAPGLGLVQVRFRRFSPPEGMSLRIPHVGWNQVEVVRENDLIDVADDEQRFYFTHSYHAECSDSQDVVAMTRYGYDFPAAFARGNVYGVQFHPEKSHRFGRALVRRFLSLRSC